MLPGFTPKEQVLEFFVPGEVVGKDFVGFNLGDRVMVVPGRNAQKYMQLVEDAANTARNTFGDWIIPELGVPVVLEMTMLIPVRKSWSKSRQAQLVGSLCTVKPDNENVENCVFDALTGHLPRRKKSSDMSPGEREVSKRRQREGGILQDDAQIADNHTRKIWCSPGDEGLKIVLRTGGHEQA